MNQEKTGVFLKTLRREKNLTQEQLAEHFNVSGRSVSRWETGRNMPDISLLVELAEFYEVDIRELIDGERKSENMENEVKESILKVAEYTDNEKNCLVKRMRTISLIGLLGLIMFVVMENITLTDLPIVFYLKGFGFGLAFSALLALLLYTTGVLERITLKNQQNEKKKKTVIAILIACAVFTFLCALFASL